MTLVSSAGALRQFLSLFLLSLGLSSVLPVAAQPSAQGPGYPTSAAPSGRSAATNLVTANGASAASEFQGQGLCRFALHNCYLSDYMANSINNGAAAILLRYRDWLGVTFPRTLQLHIRIYGDEKSFQQAQATNNSWIQHAAGFYSPKKREIVTWQQKEPLPLLKVAYHEISHALVHAQHLHLPPWLDEGLANYAALTALNQTPWAVRQQQHLLERCKLAVIVGTLRPLEELLQLDGEQFHQWDEEFLYAASWSLVFFLDKTDQLNGQLLRKVILKLKSGGPDADCAEIINASYPGGLRKLDADWKAWLLTN